ncbi:hypothetical protein HNP25_003892 [Arcicella rosea]|uniref:Uncharacterized protein n=1 Tax=Arcicella rosea TaxID=502909 RepID=A0A841EY23_9BACT|nr:hypothetical protein [Arcicella rosea]
MTNASPSIFSIDPLAGLSVFSIDPQINASLTAHFATLIILIIPCC